MKTERIAAHHLGVLGDIDVNLAHFDGKIVAVCGPNGSGKSTFLELIPGVIYRDTPSRGALAKLAQAEDSWAEITVVSGSRYVIRQRVSIAGAQSSSVLDGDGRPVLSSAKVTEYDSWSRKRMPPQQLFYGVLFAAQTSASFEKHGRFIDRSPGDRKATLLRAIGVEHLERLAEAARGRLREAEKELARTDALLSDATSRLAKLGNVDERCLEEAERRESSAQAEMVRVRAELASKRAERDRLATELTQAQERYDTLVRRKAEQAKLRADLDELRARIAKNRSLLNAERKIRQEAEQHKEFKAQLEACRVRLAAAEEAIRSETELAAAHSRRVADMRAAIQAAQVRADKAAEECHDEAAAMDAAAALGRAKADLDDAQRRLSDCESAVESIRSKSIYGAFDRVEQMGEALATISTWRQNRRLQVPDVVFDESEVERIELYASASLDKDSSMASEQRQLPAASERAAKDLEATRAGVRMAQERFAKLQRAADRLPMIEAARERQRAAHAEIDAHQASLRSMESGQRQSALAAARSAAASIRGELADLEANVARTQRAEHLLDPLSHAQARIEGYEATLRSIEPLITADDISLPDIVGATEALDAAELELKAAIAAEEQAQSAVMASHASRQLRQAEYDQAVQLRARIEELRAQVEAQTTEAADWKRLAADLGLNGVQALEIDAAGPELSELANHLLHTCYGPRWTVSVETTRTNDKGKVIEGCFIRVIDTANGRDDQIESYSGGEKVLISEALSLALTVISCRKSGVDRPTLVRDETGAALSENEAPAYVAMLRQAQALTRASCILFVSHMPSVSALADVRLQFRNGELTIE